ncbi:MAG: hypothetical protein ACE10I_03275, partial [Candidatus Acidiferrales bacterium]
MGLLVLTRPAFVIFPWVISVAFLIFAVADRRRVRIIITLALSLLMLTPWIARNYSVFGEPVFSTGLGYNLYRHNSSIIDEAFHHEGYP